MESYGSFDELVTQAFSPTGEDAFKKLYSHIYLCAYNLVGDRHTAEDISSQTLASLYIAWSKNQIRDRSKTRAWVFRVISNAAIDYFRDQARLFVSLEKTDDSEDSSLAEVIPTTDLSDIPEEYLEKQEEDTERKMRVRETLYKLKGTFRICLIQRFVFGMKNPQIAAFLGNSTRQTQRYIAKAIEEFKEIYGYEDQEQQKEEEDQ